MLCHNVLVEVFNVRTFQRAYLRAFMLWFCTVILLKNRKVYVDSLMPGKLEKMSQVIILRMHSRHSL